MRGRGDLALCQGLDQDSPLSFQILLCGLSYLEEGLCHLRVFFPFPFYYFQIGPLPPLGNCASLSSTLLSGDQVPGTVLMQGHGDEEDTGPPQEQNPVQRATHAGQGRSQWEQEGRDALGTRGRLSEEATPE